MIPYTRQAYRLLHEGVIALAQVEANGLRVDEAYFAKSIKRLTRKIEYAKQDLLQFKEIKEWKAKFGATFNINSNDQLATVLFEVLGYKPEALTESGKPATDEKALAAVDLPFVQTFVHIKKMQKTLSTYLIGIQREIVDGYIHPSFNLHLVKTFRSSADSPNFQNIPVRDKEIGNLIRSAFIPRPGRRIVEADYSGIEVRIAACYHKDPTMLTYIKDPTKDMHRDMAMECYMLTQEQVTKEIRYCGKNMFVFPQFYGDWYIDCARSLWEAIHKMKLVTAQGEALGDHLRKKGIRQLGACKPGERAIPGSFEEHLQKVEKRFWEKRFPVYAKWKQTWVDEYKAKGFFLTLTGFICQGYMKKNEIINYPVQGSAFHCLLWSLIQIQKEINRNGMKTLLTGQIHDSIVADVPEEETTAYAELVHEVMTKQLMKHWTWINVPIDVEIEATPVGQPWSKKEKYHA